MDDPTPMYISVVLGGHSELRKEHMKLEGKSGGGNIGRREGIGIGLIKMHRRHV